MSPDSKVKIGKLVLKTPVVCASGTFGFGIELEGLADFASIGAIVTKTITLAPRAGNPPPRIYEAGHGVINAVGLENPGLEGFLKEKLPLVKKLKTNAIISIGGFTDEEYEALVDALDKENICAIEANFSCPNLKEKRPIAQDEGHVFALTKKLRALTKKTLLIKLTPEASDISLTAQAAAAGGADAITLVNTYFSMAINIETQRPFLGNVTGGYSGPAIKPMAVYKVWRAAKAVNISVIGGGGIETANDAVEFLLAGAKAVSVGTQNMIEPNCAQAISRGITDYLKRKKIASVEALSGKLNLLQR